MGDIPHTVAALLFNDGFCTGDNLQRSSIMPCILLLTHKHTHIQADVMDSNKTGSSFTQGESVGPLEIYVFKKVSMFS